MKWSLIRRPVTPERRERIDSIKRDLERREAMRRQGMHGADDKRVAPEGADDE